MGSDPVISLSEQFVHLGLGATAVPQEPFDGMEWYERYGARTASDGEEGRLVAMHTFDAPWDVWEVHPRGSELVVCLDGSVTLHQELPEGTVTRTLGAGEAIVNPPGVWHTADADEPVRMLFVTAGLGTEHRPR